MNDLNTVISQLKNAGFDVETQDAFRAGFALIEQNKRRDQHWVTFGTKIKNVIQELLLDSVPFSGQRNFTLKINGRNKWVGDRPSYVVGIYRGKNGKKIA